MNTQIHNPLCIDVGNTTIVLGWSVNGDLWESFRIPTQRDYTASILANTLTKHLPVVSFSSIAISSVVPQLDQSLREALTWLQIPITFFSHGSIPSITVAYTPPEGVGADRLVNAYAVQQKYSLPAILVDLGTATTFCAVDEKGTYLGGAIAAGVATSAEGLFKKAARLKEVSLSIPPHAIGTTLTESISSGILLGHVCMIDGMVQEFSKTFRTKPFVVLTGGWGNVIKEKTTSIDKFIPHLTLEGLWLLAKEK